MDSYKGKIVLKNEILDGYISVDGEKIIYVGKDKPKGKTTFIDGYITPGLIDIHCHSSFQHAAKDNPEEVAKYHLKHGVTTILLSLYRDVSHEQILSVLDKVKSLIGKSRNIYGVHLEGPYINVNLGFRQEGEKNCSPDMNKCREYIDSGVVKQWTCAPEIDGVLDLIKEIKAYGIIPAIGHSLASYSQVKQAYDYGAKIVTHIFDATGFTDNAEFDGTKDLSFDNAVMLMDDMYYEVICDSAWVHVRKEMLDLLIKTVGVDRVVAITDLDAMGLEEGERDVAIVDGQLVGTKLTMDKVVKNLYLSNYCIEDIFKIVSLNPAKALSLFDRGEIAVGKRADLAIFDDDMNFIKLL